MMSKAGVSFSKVRDDLMKDEEFKIEYKNLRPRYEIISAVIKARTELNLTQEELALRTGTQKSNISRLERSKYNPSVDILSKITKGLGKEIHFELK